ncbi:YjjG family noncanonical pyrimidine nucleotidase [Paucilactobacillus sp. N302-9]|jgi:YjjG family noncanonical pyrimidine nucleotidase
MAYSTLLFDIDNTLLDTTANESAALSKLAIDLNLTLTPADLNYYHQLNENLWEQFEQQTIDRKYLLDNRFRLFFEHLGMTVDGVAMQQHFSQFFNHESHMITHANELLNQLQATHQLYVISNGTKVKQLGQMSAAHLQPYFNQIFLSEDIGFRKPDERFFDFVFNQLPTVPTSEMLVIGDSLTADIAGANQAQLDSVWFNPTAAENHGDYQPTYEVADLLEINQLIN